MADQEPPSQWRIEATTIRGGFALRLIGEGEGDLGKALNDADAVVVEMRDGRRLPLYDALLELINSRVLGFIVFTEQVEAGRSIGQHQTARSRSGLQ